MANGTVSYYRNIEITFSCDFDYSSIPNDQQLCSTVAYIQNEFSDTASLVLFDHFPQSKNMTFLTWSINLNFNSLIDTQWRTSGDGVCSGAKLTFRF
jgi:hypothetical protein